MRQIRINKPWYMKSRKCWYLTLKNRRVKLSKDRDEAFAMYEQAKKEAERINAESIATLVRNPKAKAPKPPRIENLKTQSPEESKPINTDLVCGRYRQFERLLMIAELLSPLRCGATMKELLSDVRDSLGIDFSEKTLVRDLTFYESIGLVERSRSATASHGRRTVYHWVNQSKRSSVLVDMAEAVSELRDNMQAAS